MAEVRAMTMKDIASMMWVVQQEADERQRQRELASLKKGR